MSKNVCNTYVLEFHFAYISGLSFCQQVQQCCVSLPVSIVQPAEQISCVNCWNSEPSMRRKN